MSTYYEYQDVGVMISHKLMNIEGWKVYGYHADESDSMTDYYSPAYWNGVAEKNGYILCVNVYGAAKPEEIRKYNHGSFTYDKNIMDKITKLKAMTVERGASEAEAESAKVMIAKLQKKAETAEENSSKYVVTGIIPGHMANPPRCNWHIEKDGIIVAKGNGLLKYAHVDDYYRYDHYMEDMQKFQKMTKDEYIKDYVFHNMHRWNESEERSREGAESHYNQLKEDSLLMAEFEKFINKLDTTCGGLLGEGDGVIYEKVIVTEYKNELKAVDTTTGSIKDGQCFILKTGFNYGRYKGLVYRIREIGEEGQKYFTAYKLNGKLTKECHGMASQNNVWYMGTEDRLTKWIEKGSISWCDIKEVKTPYEVEKVVKKTIKAEGKAETTNNKKESEETTTPETIVNNNYSYDVTEDTDTRDNSIIYVAKIKETLTKEEYLKVNAYIKSIGGYYSRFKHGFIFKENPMELLQSDSIKESEVHEEIKEEEKQTVKEEPKKTIEYEVIEDKSPSNKIIYLVKVKSDLSKMEFAEVKQKLAKINGFYSGLKNGFIFNYDPKEKLII